MRLMKTRGVAAAIVAAGLAAGAAGCGGSHTVTRAAQTSAVPDVTVTHTLSATPAASSPAPQVTVTQQAPPPAALPVLTVGSYTGTEPAYIGFSGDAGNVVTSITWASWTATGATGTGTSNIQGCVPNCAQGSETPVSATITLSDPVGGQFTAYTETRNGSTGSGPTSAILSAGSSNPGAGSSNPVDAYAQDILNTGITAPVSWIDSTGQALCSDWAAGQTTPTTDQLLLNGGILPAHLASYDSITAQDLCPSTPGTP